MNPFRLYSLVLGRVGIVLALYFLLRRKPKSAEELEPQRREWVDRLRRIPDGTVIDVHELPFENQRSPTMLLYQYDVAGVSYDASQDGTYLRQWVNLHS